MTEARGTDSRLNAPIVPVLRIGTVFLVLTSSHPRFSPTPLLRFQQASPDEVQVGERGGDLEPVQVLRQAAVAYLAEAEDVLDHAEDMFDLGTHPRLVAVLRLLDLVDPAVVAVAAIGEVLRVRGTGVDEGGLALIALIPQTRVSLSCNRYGRALRSATLAADASTV